MLELEKLVTPIDFPKILFEDEEILLLYKPANWFVHPPENPKYRRGLKRKTCTQWLTDVHNIKAFPAHRLDAATEGIFISGKNKIATANLNLQFKNNQTQKIYYAVARGWLKESIGSINISLENISNGNIALCETHYKTLAQIEHPVAVGKKFNSSRYSLLEVSPKTGRWHQIRRHLNRIAHPILGDREHGDSHHNRYFRDQLKIDGLCLWAKELIIKHPKSDALIKFESPISHRWMKLMSLFSFKL